MKNLFFVLSFLCLGVMGSTQTSYQTNNFGQGQSMLEDRIQNSEHRIQNFIDDHLAK